MLYQIFLLSYEETIIMTLQVSSASIYKTEGVLKTISKLHFHPSNSLKIVIKRTLKKTKKKSINMHISKCHGHYSYFL